MSMERGGQYNPEIPLGEKLDFDSAQRIRKWSERITALAYLVQGYEVRYQVPVGRSVIDFYMKQGPDDPGFLLEVTSMSEQKIAKSNQKKRQIESMRKSGLPFYVYNGDNIADMSREFNVH